METTSTAPNSTVAVLGEEELCVDVVDGVQITWHETRGYALRVTVDDDLNAKDAVKLAEAIKLGAAHMDAMKNAREGRSIWTEAGPDLHHGPSAVLKDVGFHFDSEYSEEVGVHFWGSLERDSEEYSLAEVRKIHRAIGRLLAKVDADPKPAHK